SAASSLPFYPPVWLCPAPPPPLSAPPLSSPALWGPSPSPAVGTPRWGSFQAPRDRFRVRRSLRSLFGARRLRPSVVTPGGGLSRPPRPLSGAPLASLALWGS